MPPSCNDCHDLSQYGTNGTAAEALKEKEKLRRDVPPLFNIKGLIHYGWDGGNNTLADTIATSLTSAAEMGAASEDEVAKRIRSAPGLAEAFAKAYPKEDKPVRFDHAVSALEAFVGGLVTRAPIDDFLLGDDGALTADQLKGAMLFDRLECGACHTGTAFGGQMLQKVGILAPWPNQEDQGLYEVTKKGEHKMVFKVPSLRNVEKNCALLPRPLGPLAAARDQIDGALRARPRSFNRPDPLYRGLSAISHRRAPGGLHQTAPRLNLTLAFSRSAGHVSPPPQIGGQPFEMHVRTIDLEFGGAKEVIASYLIEGPEGALVIETGPGSTLEALSRGLHSAGLSERDIAPRVRHPHPPGPFGGCLEARRSRRDHPFPKTGRAPSRVAREARRKRKNGLRGYVRYALGRGSPHPGGAGARPRRWRNRRGRRAAF